MGWLPIVAAAVAAWFFGRSEHPALFWLSVAVAGVAAWSFGIMHDFAYGSAAARHRRLVENMRAEGRSDAEIQSAESLPPRMSLGDAQLAPNWATSVNMGATLLAVILLVWAMIV